MAKGRYRKRRSSTVAREHFPIGKFKHKRKVLEESYIANCAVLQNEEKRNRQLEAKFRRVQQKNGELEKRTEQAQKRKQPGLLPETKELRKKRRRIANPSVINPDNSERLDKIAPSSASNRKLETIRECSLIHGSEAESDLKPCLDGIWHTLVNSASPNQLEKYISNSKKCMKAVNSITQKQVKEFETSESNICRSLKVLYKRCLISKEKYKSDKVSLTMTFNPKQPAKKTRLKMCQGASVEKKKKELSETSYADSTKRTKICQHIKGLKSRQEFEPIIGRLVDFAFAEPLHNSNNGCQQLHYCLLEEAIARSDLSLNIKITKISALPDDLPLKKFLLALKDDCKAKRLYKKIVRWLKEGRKKKFDHRFTGKETKAFCHKFMYLIDSLSRETDQPSERLKLMAIAFAGLHLRNAISLMHRITIDRAAIVDLQTSCTLYFNTCSLLLKTVSPTTWTIGYAVPYHTKFLYGKYKVGLGINTMQGREAKHQVLASFAEHATRTTRWPLVMRHEYVSNVWLRKSDLSSTNYSKSKEQYLPSELHQPGFCTCGFVKDPSAQKCKFCSSSLYKEIAKIAELGKLTREICMLLSSTAS